MITFRPITDEDKALIQKWLYSNHIKPWYTEPEDWINEIDNRTGEFSWINHLIVEHDGKAIGFAQYYDCWYAKEDWYETETEGKVFSIDYLIGEESYLGKGYGKEIVKLLTEIISNIKTAKYIIVQPDNDNFASRAVLSANGYCYCQDNKYYILQL